MEAKLSDPAVLILSYIHVWHGGIIIWPWEVRRTQQKHVFLVLELIVVLVQSAVRLNMASID